MRHKSFTFFSVCFSFLLRLLIFIYRHSLSPLLGANCRFFPSCSAYADNAIKIHGPKKGIILALKRLKRCHPWNLGGYDPVPEKITTSSKI